LLAANASEATDEESPYCKRVRALADSKAALLYAPSLDVQGGKFPENGAVDASALTGDHYRLRAAFSLSLLDVERARHVARAGEAECAQYEATRVVEEIVLQAGDYGRLPALREAAAYLDMRRGTWRAAERRTEASLAARVVPLLEAQEVFERSAGLERRRSEIDGEMARLEALDAVVSAPTDLAALMRAADDAVMEYEREASILRTLDAWQLRLTAGAEPRDASTELFGVALLSFNLGAFAQRAAEERALAAREEELSRSRSELRAKLGVFREVTRANERRASRAARIGRERLAALRSVRAALDRAQAQKAVFARDLIDLDLIVAESEQVLLEAWLVELRRLGGTRRAG
jgi:hypothetical protein